jgi:hypothetical protein
MMFCGLSLYAFASTASAVVNQITNNKFDTTLSGWTNRYGGTARWSSLDAGNNAASGSAQVVNDVIPGNGTIQLVLAQCIPAIPSSGYTFAAQALVPAGQPAGTQAYVYVHTYASGDCTGSPSDSRAQATVGPEAWEWLAGSMRTDATVHSVEVSIGVYKPAGVPAPATAHFDNLLLMQGDAGFALGPAMSGSWFNPTESGHGLMLDLVSSKLAWMCWFTFDLDGNRAWICGTGTIQGNTITFPDAFMVDGGKFGPLFNQAAVTGVPWGSIAIDFTGCGSGSMEWWTNVPQFESGSMPLARVAQLWGLSCP